MKQSKVIWERYALFATFFVMISLGVVFSPRRVSVPESLNAEGNDGPPRPKVDDQNGLASTSVPVIKTEGASNINPVAKQVVATRCGEKDRPQPLLRWPHPLLRSHIAEYEKETSSYLERSKLQSGVSFVVIYDLCPEPQTHFSFHFPAKQLGASVSDQAMQQYSEWVTEVLNAMTQSGALTERGTEVFGHIQNELLAPSPLVISPMQPEWGGVQVSFRRP